MFSASEILEEFVEASQVRFLRKDPPSPDAWLYRKRLCRLAYFLEYNRWYRKLKRNSYNKYMRELQQRPDQKEKRRVYNKTSPVYAAYRQAYEATPARKARRKEYLREYRKKKKCLSSQTASTA